MTAALNAVDPPHEQRPSRGDCAARNSRAQGAARCRRSAPPALCAADGLDRASREPILCQLSTAAVEVLDDGHRRRYCLIIFAGCGRSPLQIARFGARSNRRSQATVRYPILNLLHGRLFARRHVRETDSRIGLRFGPRPGADPTVHPYVQVITLPWRYACQMSMRREMRSARPFTVNNSGIDARNGQAYHGRKNTTTNGPRPAALGWHSCEGERAHAQ